MDARIMNLDNLGDVKLTSPSKQNVDDNNQTIVQSSSSSLFNKEQELSNNDSEIEVFDRIANKLLRSGFLLTALELHAELIERGKESTRLRDFFDNPHNFEKHFDISPTDRPTTTITSELTSTFSKNIEKTPSENTFDSLDFTHYSDEDLERHIGDERIAVLEFELRKAQHTINSLRASLTMSTTGHFSDMTDAGSSMPNVSDFGVNNDDFFLKSNSHHDSNNQQFHEFSRDFYCRGSADGDSCPGEDDKFSKQSTKLSYESSQFEPQSYYQQGSEKYSLASMIKPHEKRALNYLINEYLMTNNYKLTSITFCDENTDQDFDNWEDVGLNISRPPDLLKLYRQFWKNHRSSSSLMRTNSNATTIVSNKTIINKEFLGAAAATTTTTTNDDQ